MIVRNEGDMSDTDRIAEALEKANELHARSLDLSAEILAAQKFNSETYRRVLALQEDMAAGKVANHGQRIADLESAFRQIDIQALNESLEHAIVDTIARVVRGWTGGLNLPDFIKAQVVCVTQDAGIGVAK
jgi:hypothetical protein